jgi:hypothetical protein
MEESPVKSIAAASVALVLSLGVLTAHVRAQSAAPVTPPAPQTPTAPQRPPGGAPPSDDATKMGSPPSLPAGTTEQQMWPAATAEGWKKPVLIPWQRSFDDAVRVARATGKPILVAVNMDGEIASEHYAGVRYREPETARLFEPYVCVVASVYRHTPRDHDEQGRRVLCPRLGGVTCGEHIAAETELYEKYFDGIRVSPRHIALELDGKEMYDVYFSWDTQTVFTALVKGVENRPPPKPLDHDMPLADRTRSPDVVDRTAIETEYQSATPEVRRSLLQAVLTRREVDQVDLLRLAIFGLDLDLARLARQALAQCETESAVDLIAEALKVPLPSDEREMLIQASERLGQKFPRARTLTAVHQGLAQTSKWVDAHRASEKQYESQVRGPGAGSVETRAADSEARPQDANTRIEFAKALLLRAEDPATERRFVKLLVDDARRSARAAQELGASGWKLEVVLAGADALSGDDASARTHAVAAIEGGMLMPGATSDIVLERTELRVLALFASARQQAIRQAYRAGTTWPPEWLSDVNAAYAVLAQHPLATDEHLVSFYDFLRWLGGAARASAILDDALARFPGSPLVHDRLRARILWESGPDGLEAAYAARLAQDSSSADMIWYAGYASLVAAEHHRRDGNVDKALASYGRGIGYYEQFGAARVESKSSADHFIALAFAAQARIALERGDLELATQEILDSFTRAPASGATPDGLNITPVDTAKMLSARLDPATNADLAARLRAGLDALDPALLEKRAFELENPRPRPNRDPNGERRQTPR